MLIHFNRTSFEICKTIAKPSYMIESKILPPENLIAYNLCHLIPLEKISGVRPGCKDEALRRIIGKIITHCIKKRHQKPRNKFPSLLRPEERNRICYPQLEEGV